ncbi:MFS transporter [Micromonosporaceae bacterium DT194]|uniref:MFS transporter n=1 Tax=Melissospora conviva TaxID=3388432 RepID=UPI003C17451A
MTGLRQYLGLWHLPGAPALLIASIVGRLGMGMTSLALLLVIEAMTGRYSVAATAGAVYAVAGAAISPVVGRLADRVGPVKVLMVTAVTHPIALIWLLLASRGGADNLPMVFVACAVAGASFPPLTAAVRNAWNELTSPASGRYGLRNTALAAETTLFEVVFVVGPLVVAGFIVFADAAAALIGVALATLVGTIAVALSPAMRGWRPHPKDSRTRGLGPLRLTGFPALLLCVAGLGIAFGVSGVAVPAFSGDHATGKEAETLAGILLAVWGVGSATGGLWFGTRRPAENLSRQFGLLLAGVGASFLVFALLPNPVALGIALVIGGALIAPALTLENMMVGRIAPPSMMNEAYTWVVTMAIGSAAAGGALAGLIVDHFGVGWAFVFAALAVGVAAVTAGRPGGSIARADTESRVRAETGATLAAAGH